MHLMEKGKMEMKCGDGTGNRSPLVSVIIPTYGRNKRLRNAVHSVIDQTYENIELFIVDDGSPHPISESLRGIDFDSLHSATFIQHDENRGANAARNSGIRAATGDYIAFLDSDDRWDETKISRQVETFVRADPAVGVVYTGKKTESDYGTNFTVPSAEGDICKDLLTGETFGQFSSVMVKSEVIEAAGLPDERFPGWQDREWFLRLAKHCHFQPIPDALTHRRVGLSDSITRNFEKKRDVAYPLFVEKHYSYAREYGFFLARTFLATLRYDLARSAVHAGRYSEGRKYFLLAFVAHPLHRPVHAHLLASIGGKWTYKPAAFLRRKFSTVRSLLGF